MVMIQGCVTQHLIPAKGKNLIKEQTLDAEILYKGFQEMC